MKAKAVIVWCFAIILLLSGGILFKINYQIYKKTQTKVEKI